MIRPYNKNVADKDVVEASRDVESCKKQLSWGIWNMFFTLSLLFQVLVVFIDMYLTHPKAEYAEFMIMLEITSSPFMYIIINEILDNYADLQHERILVRERLILQEYYKIKYQNS